MCECRWALGENQDEVCQIDVRPGCATSAPGQGHGAVYRDALAAAGGGAYCGLHYRNAVYCLLYRHRIGGVAGYRIRKRFEFGALDVERRVLHAPHPAFEVADFEDAVVEQV